MRKNVYIGMSGGVDSSLSAALLIEQGYKVTGVYMKNWTRDLPGAKCPWADDLADAKRVAVRLGIDFKVFDFENEYKQKVVDYMIDEYKNGRTPNPDIMCNQEVKFKLFLESAIEDGADMIATGHYARVLHSAECESDESVLSDRYEKIISELSGEGGLLLQAVDQNKDQTYFLYRVTGKALGKTLFPIGNFTKPTVRKMAAERGLITADKPDSQGICFVGQVGIKEFLSEYIETKPGKIIDKKTGRTLGIHSGAIFYTIGQRHGLDIGGGLPYYVVGKDMDKNEVYVTTNLNDNNLWLKTLNLADVHWINDKIQPGIYTIRLRHRASLIEAELKFNDNWILEFKEPQKAIAKGQSAVIYDGLVCLGGGIII